MLVASENLNQHRLLTVIGTVCGVAIKGRGKQGGPAISMLNQENV